MKKMRVHVVEDFTEMSYLAAEEIINELKTKPSLNLGLATGNSPVGVYSRLLEAFKQDRISFSKSRIFILDEYYPISPENELSFVGAIQRRFLNHLDLLRNNIFYLDSLTSDPEGECRRYEREIKNAGGIDLQILGIGRNGHIGFNEPGSSWDSITRLVDIDPETIAVNSRGNACIPAKALTMGIKTIMNARRIILLASGKNKSLPLFNMIHGRITHKCPASILQLHPNTDVIADKDAASLLMIQGMTQETQVSQLEGSVTYFAGYESG